MPTSTTPRPAGQSSVDDSRSPFLNLPPELRNEIYDLFLQGPSPTLPLLTTSHQIKMETRPRLFSRPITFASQSKLFAWTTKNTQTDLNRVRELTISLTDIDLSPLLKPQPPESRSSCLTIWSLYTTELLKAETAFASVLNLRKLTLIPPRTMHSALLRNMYLKLLALIPKHWPKLRVLVLHDEQGLLDEVPALQSLAKVDFVSGKTDSRKAKPVARLVRTLPTAREKYVRERKRAEGQRLLKRVDSVHSDQSDSDVCWLVDEAVGWVREMSIEDDDRM